MNKIPCVFVDVNDEKGTFLVRRKYSKLDTFSHEEQLAIAGRDSGELVRLLTEPVLGEVEEADPALELGECESQLTEALAGILTDIEFIQKVEKGTPTGPPMSDADKTVFEDPEFMMRFILEKLKGLQEVAGLSFLWRCVNLINTRVTETPFPLSELFMTEKELLGEGRTPTKMERVYLQVESRKQEGKTVSQVFQEIADETEDDFENIKALYYRQARKPKRK